MLASGDRKDNTINHPSTAESHTHEKLYTALKPPKAIPQNLFFEAAMTNIEHEELIALLWYMSSIAHLGLGSKAAKEAHKNRIPLFSFSPFCQLPHKNLNLRRIGCKSCRKQEKVQAASASDLQCDSIFSW